MLMREGCLFALFFFLFPLCHTLYLHRFFFQGINSAAQSVLYSFILTPALNIASLLLLYLFFPHQANNFYLTVILIINFSLVSLSFIYDKQKITGFYGELINDCKQDYWFKLILGIFTLVFISCFIRIRPVDSDILEYFEIGKVFYKIKAWFYPVLPYYPENYFSSNASHPPFFSLLQAFAYLIQGASDYYRVHMLILAYYMVTLFLLLLTIMKDHLVAGFLVIVAALISSRYAALMFLLPLGLDTFRLTYFMFSLCLLQYLAQFPANKKLLFMFSLSLGLSLTTHSSGLLFLLLVIPIFLAVYTPDSRAEKYKGLLWVLCISCLLGGWQYIYNFHTLGKFISDDVLLWSKYGYEFHMRYERDLYSFHKLLSRFLEQFRLQGTGYGYFYALFFLLCFFNISFIFKQLKSAVLNIFSYKKEKLEPFFVYILFIFGFLMVELISIILGNSLIVKNYRYLLTTYPALIVSILFLSFRLRVFDFLMNSNQLKKLGLSLVVCTLLFQQAIFFSNRMLVSLGYQNLKFTPRAYLTQQNTPSLDAFQPGHAEILSYLEKNMGKEDVIFAFDRGQLYGYLTEAKINFYLNDSTVDLFAEKTKEALYLALKERGIKFIFVSYSKPFILTQSVFSDLLVDPNYVKLVINKGSNELFELNSNQKSSDFFGDSLESNKVHLNENESKTIQFSLKTKHDYLVEINTPDSQKAFYSLFASKKIDALMQLSSDVSSKLWFSLKEDELNHAETEMITFRFSSKDKPLDLNVSIKQLRH